MDERYIPEISKGERVNRWAERHKVITTLASVAVFCVLNELACPRESSGMEERVAEIAYVQQSPIGTNRDHDCP